MATSTLTARDIVQRACRILKVSALDDPPSAAVAAEMLQLLNGMLSNWSVKGLSGYAHAALTLDATMGTDAALDLGLPYLLAAVGAADFEAALGQTEAALAQDCMNDARKLYGTWTTDVLDTDTALKYMPGLGSGYTQF
jgi:hypothetical protein